MNNDNVSHGLWVDNAKRDVLTVAYFDTLTELGIDLIAIMIDPMDGPWNPTWKPSDVEKALKLADRDCIEVVLTTWPYPNKDQIDEMARDMKDYLGVGPVVGWEIDVEFNWKTSHVDGFQNLDKAGDYLVKTMTDVCAPFQARKEMTSFTEHTENSKRADVAPHMDRLIVQAYSVSKRNEKLIGVNHRYGPGHMQRRTLDRTLTIPAVKQGSVDIGVGLAAWRQRFAGHEPESMMQRAYDAALEYDVVDVRWWSGKHIIGKKKNPYAYHTIKSLRGRS